MAFNGFPTEAALDLASIHCDPYGKITHAEVANDIHEAGLHLDDWTAAVRQIEGITDPDAEDRKTDEIETNIYIVGDHYYAKRDCGET